MTHRFIVSAVLAALISLAPIRIAGQTAAVSENKSTANPICPASLLLRRVVNTASWDIQDHGAQRGGPGRTWRRRWR